MIARSAISHSGRFSDTSITRSPAPTPMRFSAAASRDTVSAASRQLIDRHSPAFFAHRNGLSPCSPARVKNIVTRFGNRSSWRKFRSPAARFSRVGEPLYCASAPSAKPDRQWTAPAALATCRSGR
jgi:hypothetical protein